MEKTKQETFDTVARGLIAQGQQAFAHIVSPFDQYIMGNCRYRHELPDGTVLKCAAGMLIPDDQYHPDLERLGIEGEILRILEGHDIDLVRYLRNAHDNWHAAWNNPPFPEYIERALCRIADEFGLNIEALDAALDAAAME